MSAFTGKPWMVVDQGALFLLKHTPGGIDAVSQLCLVACVWVLRGFRRQAVQ